MTRERTSKASRHKRNERRQKVLELMDVSKTPVFRAFSERITVSGSYMVDWWKGKIDDVEEFASECLARAHAPSAEWFHHVDLFEVAYDLALRLAENDPERRKWLDVAWDAAERSMEMKPTSGCVARFVRDWKTVDRNLAQRMIDKLGSPTPMDEYPAVRQFSLACLYRALDDNENASKAVNEAYRLCPDDLTIASFTRRVRTSMKDYSGALEILRAEELETAQNPFSKGDLYLPASQSIQIAEHCTEIGQRDEALERLHKVWLDLNSEESREHWALNLLQNGCATQLGLILLTDGDVKAAVKWLSSSQTAPSRALQQKGCDLRLAEKLLCEPSAKKQCIEYLEAAAKTGPERVKAEAESVLRRLEGPE